MTGKEATKKKDLELKEEEEKIDEKFIHPEREATKEEEILLFATALEIAVKFLFSNNLYQFGGRTYLQTDGGLARFKKEYEGLTKIAPPFNLFIYMY